MSTWSDGSTANRTAAELEGLTPDGFLPADIDPAILAWDDPLGIGYASTHIPGMFGTQSGWPNANRAMFHRCISGGLVNKLRGLTVVQSGNIDLAIYASTGSGTSAAPGQRVWSSGSIACPAVQSGGFSVNVSPGVIVKARQHWFAMSCDNATAQFMCVNSVNQFFATFGWAGFVSSTFPLPDPAPAINTSGTAGISRHPFLIGTRT